MISAGKARDITNEVNNTLDKQWEKIEGQILSAARCGDGNKYYDVSSLDDSLVRIIIGKLECCGYTVYNYPPNPNSRYEDNHIIDIRWVK